MKIDNLKDYTLQCWVEECLHDSFQPLWEFNPYELYLYPYDFLFQRKRVWLPVLYSAGFWKLDACCSIKNQLMWHSSMKEVWGKRSPPQTNQFKVSLTHDLLSLKGRRVFCIHTTSGSWNLPEFINYVGWSWTRITWWPSQSSPISAKTCTPWVYCFSHVGTKSFFPCWCSCLPCDSKDK